MATVEQAVLRGETRIVLSGVSWELFEQLRDNDAWIRQFRARVRERFLSQWATING